MPKTLTCEICGAEAQVRTGTQKTCLDPECRRRLRRKAWSKDYYAKRDDPVCVWCGKIIKEKRKRQYHTWCRAQKNRERVADYYEETKGASRSSEKTPRSYRGKLRCKFCRKMVKRTGARQLICKSIECKRKLKNLRKRERRIERREVPTRIKRMDDARTPSQPVIERRRYKVAVGA